MISHILLNVSDLTRSEAFYLSVLKVLGYRRADFEPHEYSRITNGQDAVIVLSPVEERFSGIKFHRNAVGLNHFALAVSSRDDVDRMEQNLKSLGIPILGEGKVDLDYRKEYYTLAFEDPDRIMIEIVHHDPFYFSFDDP